METWKPFSSERQHPGELKVILLFVWTDGDLTREEFYIGCNALALHQAGIAFLVCVFWHDQASEDESGTITPWARRSRQLISRLRKCSTGQGAEALLDGSSDVFLSAVIARVLESSPAAEPFGSGPVTLFFSFCHKDEALRDELEKHLRLLERTGLIKGWHDRRIPPASDWAQEIDVHLYTADLILLLLSADFFASDYCSEIEVPVALKRHHALAARAVPVVLRPVVWQTSPLAQLQALPRDARPVTTWDSVDAAFVDVCEGILASVLCWRVGLPPPPATPRPTELQRSTQRRRVLDAAMPAEIEVGTSIMLVVLVRMPSSSGLRGLVAVETTYGITEEVVQSKPVTLRFPMTAGKKPDLWVAKLASAPEIRDFRAGRFCAELAIDFGCRLCLPRWGSRLSLFA